MMAVEKSQSNYDCAQERERRKRETDTRAGEILGEVRPNSGAKSGPGLHDQGNHNIDVSLHRMSDRPVACRNDDLKQIGAYRNVRRYP